MLSFLPAEQLVVAIVVAYLLHLLISAISLHRTKSVRNEVASLGKELLENLDITNDRKQHVEFLLGIRFSWKFVAIASLFFATTSMKKFLVSNSDEIRNEKLKKFYRLHLKATLAASPIWAVVFNIVLWVRLLELMIRFWMSKSTTKDKLTRVDLYKDLDSNRLIA